MGMMTPRRVKLCQIFDTHRIVWVSVTKPGYSTQISENFKELSSLLTLQYKNNMLR